MQSRSYPPEFKLKVVLAVINKEKTIAQLCREHNISDSLIHAWRKLYLQKGEAAFRPVAKPKATPARTPAEQEVRDLQNKVAELERFCGQLALENTILKKARELMNKNAKP